MKRIEYTTVDKSLWPTRGEWDSEPDKIQWSDESTGLPCLIVRGPSGALCGYVGVSKGHRWHGVEYSSGPEEAFDVHGGLTFSDSCADGPPDRGICHVVEEGEDDAVWWLGFDCAHSGDLTPAYDQSTYRDEWYKDVGYVTAEVESLARQIVEFPQ